MIANQTKDGWGDPIDMYLRYSRLFCVWKNVCTQSFVCSIVHHILLLCDEVYAFHTTHLVIIFPLDKKTATESVHFIASPPFGHFIYFRHQVHLYCVTIFMVFVVLCYARSPHMEVVYFYPHHASSCSIQIFWVASLSFIDAFILTMLPYSFKVLDTTY